MCYDDIETSNSYLKNGVITISLSDKFRIWRITIQCPRQRAKPVHITGIRCSRRGPDYVAYVVVFLSSSIIYRLYELTLSAQAEVTLQLRVSLSDILQRFLADSVLLGGGGRVEFFHRGPDPLSASMQPHCFILCQTKIK